MKPKKIPTIIGLLLVFGAVFIFRLVFDNITPLLSRASPTLSPSNVTFSNISDSSFTVSWITETPTTGAIVVDGNGIGTLYDERDESGVSRTNKPTLGSYTLHNIIVRNTRPQTTYNIRILSGKSLFQNGTKPFTVTTGSSIPGTGTNLEPAYGSVTLSNGLPASGAIVYLTPEGGQTLSAFVTTTGSWVIPLHLARNETLSAYIPSQERLNESITIRSSQGITNALTDTLNDNPVPAMTIGKDYNFQKIQAESPKQLVEGPPSVLGINTDTVTQMVSITQPKQGAYLTSQLPLFQGTGVKGKQALVIVGITNPQSSMISIGEDGIWRYTPEIQLQEGKQSITITTQDKDNKTVALTHTFEIFKSGTQVLGDATPSATLTPTEIPTPTATLAGEPIPTTGNELPTLILLLFGSLLFIGGSASYLTRLIHFD